MIWKRKKSFKYYLWWGFVHYFFMVKINEVINGTIPGHPHVSVAITGILMFFSACIDYGRDYDYETNIGKAYLRGREDAKKD